MKHPIVGLNDFDTNFQAHPRAPASLLNVINDAPAKTAGHVHEILFLRPLIFQALKRS